MEKRADALDALRGFAIITMILSGSIPFSGPAALPGWMYHAQLPPPDHVFNPNLPGITWVDLVFPFFLFAMGAAFPFALRKRIEQGIPYWKLSLQAIQRGFLLVVFALFLQHSKPYALSGNPESFHWIIGLVGFGILFLIYYRYPRTLNSELIISIKILTAVGALVLFSQLTYSKGTGFLLSRSDIIILVLANVALFGSIIWLFTKDNLLIRLSLLAILLAFRITHNIEGSWTGFIWNLTPAPEIYKFYFLQYLFIVIPGTIAGDLFYKWMKSTDENSSTDKNKNYVYLFLITIALILLNLFGLYSRYLTLNLIGNILLLSAGLLLLKHSKSQLLTLYKNLFTWGTFWLLLGLAFESFEGGIKKDPSTLSYYLVTSGLAFMTLIAFSIISDYWKKSKYINLLIENGQNPMIAYIAGSNFVMPILALTGLSTILNYLLINPWLGFLKGLIFTLLAALVTSIFTKKKIFWRS
jgi:predicted acyltransferase